MMERDFDYERQSSIEFDGVRQEKNGSHLQNKGDQMVPAILITSVPQCVCRAKVSGSTFEIEGLTKEAIGGQSEAVVRATKDLLCAILKVKVSSIKSDTRILGSEGSSSIRMQHTLHLPSHTIEQIQAPELKSAVTRFVQLIGPEVCQTEEGDLADPHMSSLVVEAANQFKKQASGKVVPPRMEIESPLWAESIRLSPLVGDPPVEIRTELKVQISGAFRGFFIDGRETFFLKDCKLDHKPLRISFDEERFFETIKKLSRRVFAAATIRYTEHRTGNKVDHLELTEIIGVTDDFFEAE